MKVGIHRSSEGAPLDLILESETKEEDRILIEVYAEQPKFSSVRSAQGRAQIILPIPEIKATVI